MFFESEKKRKTRILELWFIEDDARYAAAELLFYKNIWTIYVPQNVRNGLATYMSANLKLKFCVVAKFYQIFFRGTLFSAALHSGVNELLLQLSAGR